MKLEDLYKLRVVLNKEIDKMERNQQAQRRFVAKKGKANKKKTLNERVQEIEKKLSK